MLNRIKYWTLAITLGILILVSVPSIRAASLTVCAVGCDHTTIGSAISAAAPDDDIFIGPGIYIENITVDRNLKLVGAGANLVILQGAADASAPYNGTTHSVVTIDTGVTATISGVTIQEGDGNVYDDTTRHQIRTTVPAHPLDDRGRRVGGGIDNNGTLILSHSIVQNNTVVGDNASGWTGSLGPGGGYGALGGGIYNASGSMLTINHCNIFGNTALGGSSIHGAGAGGGFGGGIFNATGATIVLNQSSVISNMAQGGNPDNMGGAGAGLGGGIFSNGAITVSSSTISGNDAYGGIGGAYGGYSLGGGGGFGGTNTGGYGAVGGFAGGGSNAAADGGDGGFGGGAGGGCCAGNVGGYGGGNGGNNGGGHGGFGGGGGGGNGGGGGGGLGGGIFANAGTIDITSSTIAGNDAIGGAAGTGFAGPGSGQGGGLFSNGVAVTVDNTILADNTIGGPGVNIGSNCAISDGTGYSTAGGSFVGSNNLVDNTGGDSCNGFTFDGTLALPPLSDNGGPTQTHNPIGTNAINNGAACGSIDQRDVLRPQNSTCDQGAIEVTTTSNVPVVVLPIGTRNYSAGDGIITLEPGATTDDTDSGDFNSVVINFQSGHVSGEDLLDMLNQGTGTGQIALVDIGGTNYVYYEGVVLGTYTPTASTINITFNRNDTVTAIQALMRVVTFENTSANPTAGTRTVAFTLTDSDGNTTTSTTDIVILVPGYDSTPGTGSTINIGSAIISNTISTVLTVHETGNATLDVDVPASGLLTGANPDDFYIANDPPFSIADGSSDQSVIIQCTPSAVGLRAATLTFDTNDPVQSTVIYTLNCTGIASSTPDPSPPNDEESDDNEDGAHSSASPSNGSELQEFDCYPWVVIVPSLTIPDAQMNCLPEHGKLLPEPSPFHYLGYTAEVTVNDAGGTPVYEFNPSLKICFRYTQKELDAVGNNPANFLIQTHYQDTWESLTTISEGDPSPMVLGRACAPVGHLTLFAVFAGNIQIDLSTDEAESLTDNRLNGVKYLPETGIRPIGYLSKQSSVKALAIITIVTVGSGLLIKRSRRNK